MPTLFVVAGVVIAFFVFSRFWTEWLWYSQVGYSDVLRTEWLSRGALFLLGGAVMAGAIWLNLRLAYRHRPMYVPTTPQQQDLDRYREAFEPLRRVVFVAGPLVAGFFAGSAASTQWQTMLMALNGETFGQADPIHGIDVSFYVFTLPFLRFVLSFLMTVTFFSAAVAVFTHYLYGGLQIAGPGQRISRAARVHVAVLAGIFVLFIAANYWLDRYSMLSTSGDRWDGAFYTDVNAVLPARAILAVIGVLVAVLFFYAGARGTWRLPAIGVSLMVVSGILAAGVYPAIVQAVRVNPNAQGREAPYLQHNIDATRVAYGLDGIETEPYEARTDAEAGQLREDAESTASIRLLDPSIVSPTFRQLQQNRPYYTFTDQLSVDRYEIDGELQDTVIAVRELNMAQVESNWVNEHTVYTHGYGVVAAYGNRVNLDGRPTFFQSGIPTTGVLGEYEPRIYFGPNAPDYSIVGAPEGTTPWELDYPDDDAPNGQQNYTYSGDGGPSVGNLWNQLLFAARFGSEQILFSDRVTSESQILFHRDPLERVARVAPYLTLESKAYPAVVDTDGDGVREVVWVVDAYTTSDHYPYAEHQTFASATTDTFTDARASEFAIPDTINYIRNSVKAVVNAYTGEVTLYAWDPEDPVLQTWQNVFPSTLAPISEITGDLMGHLRYPEDMFKVQRELLTRYHVTDAATFFSGGDFWTVPNDPVASTDVAQPPYYLTLQMPGQEAPSFSLSSSFIISGREVLTGFLAVNSETGSSPGEVDPDYGTLRLLELPRDLTVPGPGQVQNNFNSNAEVAEQLNIIAQGDSRVLRGNLLTLPVGGGVLYVQPVYVQSSGTTTLPLLRRVLVAFGDSVGYAATLDEALNQVFGGDSGADAGDADVDPEDPTDPGSGTGDGDDPAADAQQRLSDALADAAQALADSEAALADGDWAAYGEAQQRLQTALEEALAAEAEISGETTGDDTGDGTTDDTGDGTTGDAGTDAPADDGAEG
ncbi:MAG TPA: UPF0182 family protein [Actinotalea caeni]|uniref:UPF0182 family membrane protein n=1 Tax=Actinotalea caeni TaxID=1348467 RepID=UPI002B4B5D7D|nr:UPF0182 family protein [Actinotalea caeni]HLV54786.1 UPF0182 family protein [Actinotalea caeni]